jgi:RHS repeat-associated protein
MVPSRLFRFLCSGFALVLFLLSSSASPATHLVAQTDDPPPPLPEDLLPPTAVTPPDMAYQPPADADTLTDFLPPNGDYIAAPPAQPITSTTPITPTTTITATTAVTLTEPITQLISFEEGEIAVVFEEGTLTAEADSEAKLQLTLLPLPQNPLTLTHTFSNSIDSLVLQQFQVEVVQDGEIVSDEFSKPVRLIVDLRPLMHTLDATYQTWSYYLAYQDEANPDIWIEVPLDVYQSDGLLSAEVMHFSNWAAGVRPERWNPSWTPPTVSTFSGAVTYNYPLELPPGRRGLQPAVSLSYSSRALDGRIRDGESGPIGDGWSIGEISVVRVGVELSNDANTRRTIHPDKFRLVFNGTGHELFPVAGANTTLDATVRYTVKDAPGYYLERNYDASAPNTDGIYWILITPDGTRYRLGYFADAEEWQHVTAGVNMEVLGHLGRTHSGEEYSGIAWHVDTVTDAFGNQMTYHYHTLNTTENLSYWNGNSWQGFDLTTRQNRINDIKYNYPTRITNLPAEDTVPRLTSTPATRIEFRPSNTVTDDHQFLINSIFIYHGSGANPISEYRINSQGIFVDSPGCFNYEVNPPPAIPPYEPRRSYTRIVNSIQQFAGTDNNATTSDTGHALPATTFTHNYLSHFTKNNQPCFQFYYMTGYQNGYGGTVSFTYSSDNRSVGDYQRHDDGYSYWYEWPLFGYSYWVSEMRANDGRNLDLRTTYDYTTPCYAQWAAVPSGGVNCAEANAPEQYGPLVGFSTTTQTSYDYADAVMAKQITTFSQTVSNGTLGRPTQTQVKNSSDTLLTKTNHTYNSLNINGRPNMFTYTSETKTYQFQNGGSPTLSSKTTYEYNTSHQGNAQYGNLTHIRQYDSDTATTPYQTTVRNYTPNITGQQWLVGFLTSEAVYQGNLTTLLHGSWLHYDDNSSETAVITQGKLTRSRSFIPISCSAVPGGGSDCANIKAYQTIETTYGYNNPYGNQTSLTTYTDYGYRTFNSSGTQLVNIFPTGSYLGPSTTTIAYDPIYNLYPISTTNSLSQTTQFKIYGFNGEAAHQFSNYTTPTGLLKQVTEANGATTKYEYDPFGRLQAMFDGYNFAGFNDSDPWNGDPVTLYRYWDNTWNNATTFLNPAGNAPFYISAQQRPGSFPAPATSSSGFAFNDQTFYDGFGRPIQTRSIWHWVEGQTKSREIISHTDYGANGQVSCQSTPYDVSFYTDQPKTWPTSPFYTTGTCTNKPHTTTYDPLGRPLVITAPDGATTTYNYFIVNTVTVDGRNLLALTNIKDANNHIIQHYTNNLGQLALVRELSGAGTTGDPYVSYADTRYYYDPAGNLEEVIQSDPSSTDPTTWLARTTMTYDGYGRKLTMNDPDMGNWSYAYDAAGNLTRQKDAKGQAICFSYDKLNRVLTRALDSTPTDGCPSSLPTSGSYHLASYVYDTAVNGIGKLHTTSWGPTPGQNKDTFAYDTLGRVTSQLRLIDNRSYTMSYSGFDALHRPTSITYPNNEVVTVTYDREGENSLTAGGIPLVNKVTYNSRDQIRLLDRQGAPDTIYSYFESGSSLFRLQTIQHGSLYTDNKPDFGYTYDPLGNITQMTTTSTAGTDTQSFAYDHLNRLTSACTYSNDSCIPNPIPTNRQYVQTYTYDQLGNIDSRTDKVDSTVNTYDYIYGSKPHAVTSVTNSASPWHFTYDANGNMSTRADATGVYTHTFDVENRLTSVIISPTLATSTFTYDATGIRVKSSQPGQTIYYPFPGYEEEVRTPPTVNLTANGQSAIQLAANQSFTLAWNSNTTTCSASGQWSGSKATSGSQTMTAPATVGTYTYTLTCSHIGGSGSASVTVQVVPPPTLTFTVNGQSSAIVPPYTSFTLAWNSSNASSCSATNAWSGSRAVSGSTSSNQKTVGTYTYTLTCTGPAGTISKSVIVTVNTIQCPPACGGGDTHWLPPLDETIVTAPLRENMNWSSEPPTSKSHHLARPSLQGGSSTIIRTTYSLAGQTIATRVSGDPVSSNNGLFFILSDHLGSTSLLTTSSGNVVPGSATYYLPFGGYRGATPTQTITDRDFTGQRENLEIGLLYYNARYYAPRLGRFISADALVPDPTNPQSYNRYAYVENQPLNFNDPTGHCKNGRGTGVGTCQVLGAPEVSTGDWLWYNSETTADNRVQSYKMTDDDLRMYMDTTIGTEYFHLDAWSVGISRSASVHSPFISFEANFAVEFVVDSDNLEITPFLAPGGDISVGFETGFVDFFKNAITNPKEFKGFVNWSTSLYYAEIHNVENVAFDYAGPFNYDSTTIAVKYGGTVGQGYSPLDVDPVTGAGLPPEERVGAYSNFYGLSTGYAATINHGRNHYFPIDSPYILHKLQGY